MMDATHLKAHRTSASLLQKKGAAPDRTHQGWPASELIADRGYDSDQFRAALECRGIEPCVPSRKNRKVQHPCDTQLHRQRHHVENMFGKLKDRRRVATRYDRCADIFLGAIILAATLIFWL